MKVRYLFLVFLALAACEPTDTTDVQDRRDTTREETADTINVTREIPDSNAAFRRISVQRVRDSFFVVRGQARVFEASYSWVVEDGHNEIRAGHGMTSAGAPEWGDFRFSLKMKKPDPNTTLHLVLFESSPKDGSRQHQLPVLLY